MGGTRFDDAPNQKKYADVGLTDNNGLRHTVEILEAMYQIKSFPNGAPTLKASLKESGKSRADLWALAGIVAVEYGIETNNMKCRDSSSTSGCHHLQGKPGCSIALNRTIPFRTGRTDCIPTDSARPYMPPSMRFTPTLSGTARSWSPSSSSNLASLARRLSPSWGLILLDDFISTPLSSDMSGHQEEPTSSTMITIR